MSPECYEDFINSIDDECFTPNNGSWISTKVVEYNENNTTNNYKIRLKSQLKDTHAIMFRIEDFKERAHYLKNQKRGPLKDYDLTFIDDNIYQIEVKKSDRNGGHGVSAQLSSGTNWMKHIVRVGFSETLDSVPNNIFNICIIIPKRKTLSRSRKRLDPINNYEEVSERNQNNSYTTYRLKGNGAQIPELDLTRLIFQLVQHGTPNYKLDDIM